MVQCAPPSDGTDWHAKSPEADRPVGKVNSSAPTPVPISVQGPASLGQRILVVKSEGAEGFSSETFAAALRDEGYAVTSVTGAADCLKQVAQLPDLVVLDSLRPGMRWTELCRRILAIADVPILIGARLEPEIEAVLAFELGVTGYLSHASRTKELVARVRAALRSPSEQPGPRFAKEQGESGMRVHGPVELDLVSREVKVEGVPVYLARREFDLLFALMNPPGPVRTRQELIEKVWAGSQREGSRTLDTHIRRLRLKIERDPARPELLITVRGVGFRFADECTSAALEG